MSQTYRIGPLNFTGSQAILSASLDVSGSGRFTNNLTVTGSLYLTGSTQSGNVNHVLTYNTASGEVFFTASSAVAAAGSTTIYRIATNLAQSVI